MRCPLVPRQRPHEAWHLREAGPAPPPPTARASEALPGTSPPPSVPVPSSLSPGFGLFVCEMGHSTGLSSRHRHGKSPKPGIQLALTSAGPHHVHKQRRSVRPPPFVSDPPKLAGGAQAFPSARKVSAKRAVASFTCVSSRHPHGAWPPLRGPAPGEAAGCG